MGRSIIHEDIMAQKKSVESSKLGPTPDFILLNDS